MTRHILFVLLAAWLLVSGSAAQGLLPVQVNAEKKEESSRVVKKRGTVTPVPGGKQYTPEVAERTQKVALTIKLLSMAPSPLSDVAVK
ncbi:MAG: hypothetical protein FJ395_00350 [Verrucomicrobia bacterium]|nr:hypothetical protein [Verrucomicrobiota bacterium]